MSALTTSRFLPALMAAGLVLGLQPALAQMDHNDSEHAESKATEPHHDMDADDASGKVRCAFDGMLMKTSAMVERTTDGMPIYFCSAEQADAYAEAPGRYRSQIRLGHLRINLNVLTAKEHMGVMNAMGMGGMASMDPKKSHHVAAYFTQHGQDIPMEGVALSLRLSGTDGPAKIVPLKFNKMMKTFEAAVDLEANKEQEFGVLITTPTVDVSI